MQIEVSLGGFIASWRFDGTHALRSWIGDGQWMDEGGLKMLRVPASSYFTIYQSRIRQTLIASSPINDVRVFTIDGAIIAAGDHSIDDLILRCLGIEDEPREFQRLQEASQILDRRPTAFIVPLSSPYAHEAVSGCQEFIEKVQKVGGFRRPTIFAIVAGETPPLLPFYSFLRGRPDGMCLCDESLDGAELWRSYVHQRLAWESTGNLSLAENWDRQFGFQKIPVENDDLLENCLNRVACAAYKELSPDTVNNLNEFIRNISSSNRLLNLADVAALNDQALVWQPIESSSYCVSPWAARATLLGEPNSPYRHILRDSLSCRPLSNELLSICFAMESRERQICCTMMPHASYAKDETAKQYEDFLKEAESSPVDFYPIECPARMSDVWQFASFGEILAQTRAGAEKSRTRARHRVRLIRNSLAHGHYAAWRMLKEVRRLQTSLR